jgi:hypothetical protein
VDLNATVMPSHIFCAAQLLMGAELLHCSFQRTGALNYVGSLREPLSLDYPGVLDDQVLKLHESNSRDKRQLLTLIVILYVPHSGTNFSLQFKGFYHFPPLHHV